MFCDPRMDNWRSMFRQCPPNLLHRVLFLFLLLWSTSTNCDDVMRTDKKGFGSKSEFCNSIDLLGFYFNGREFKAVREVQDIEGLGLNIMNIGRSSAQTMVHQFVYDNSMEMFDQFTTYRWYETVWINYVAITGFYLPKNKVFVEIYRKNKKSTFGNKDPESRLAYCLYHLQESTDITKSQFKRMNESAKASNSPYTRFNLCDFRRIGNRCAKYTGTKTYHDVPNTLFEFLREHSLEGSKNASLNNWIGLYYFRLDRTLRFFRTDVDKKQLHISHTNLSGPMKNANHNQILAQTNYKVYNNYRHIVVGAFEHKHKIFLLCKDIDDEDNDDNADNSNNNNNNDNDNVENDKLKNSLTNSNKTKKSKYYLVENVNVKHGCEKGKKYNFHEFFNCNKEAGENLFIFNPYVIGGVTGLAFMIMVIYCYHGREFSIIAKKRKLNEDEKKRQVVKVGHKTLVEVPTNVSMSSIPSTFVTSSNEGTHYVDLKKKYHHDQMMLQKMCKVAADILHVKQAKDFEKIMQRAEKMKLK